MLKKVSDLLEDISPDRSPDERIVADKYKTGILLSECTDEQLIALKVELGDYHRKLYSIGDLVDYHLYKRLETSEGQKIKGKTHDVAIAPTNIEMYSERDRLAIKNVMKGALDELVKEGVMALPSRIKTTKHNRKS